MTEVRTVQLREVLTRVSRPVAIDADTDYCTMGVRWYGVGCFLKEPLEGRRIAAKSLFAVEPDDVVFSRLFAWKGSFGIVKAGHAGAVASNEFPTYRACGDLSPDYFELWAGRTEVWAEAEAASTGTTANSRNRLSEECFLDMEIELPPLGMQRRVVAAVDAASRAVLTARSELDAARDLFAAAVERELVADGDWTDLPEGWRMVELKDVADVRSGITKGRKTKDALHAVPFIRAANVQSGFLDLALMKTIEVTTAEIERFRLEAGDVLMIEGGNAEHLGRGWIFEGYAEPCLHQNHVFRARPDRSAIDPHFLAYAIAASPARHYCRDNAKKTTNLASINKTQISRLPVPLPPLDLQREVVTRLNAFRAVLVTAGRAVRRNEQLRAALVQSLVDGTLRAPRISNLGKAS